MTIDMFNEDDDSKDLAPKLARSSEITAFVRGLGPGDLGLAMRLMQDRLRGYIALGKEFNITPTRPERATRRDKGTTRPKLVRP